MFSSSVTGHELSALQYERPRGVLLIIVGSNVTDLVSLEENGEKTAQDKSGFVVCSQDKWGASVFLISPVFANVEATGATSIWSRQQNIQTFWENIAKKA